MFPAVDELLILRLVSSEVLQAWRIALLVGIAVSVDARSLALTGSRLQISLQLASGLVH